ncbi:HPP family protein [Microbacterium sp. NPDC089987]|uniref:CBS domain-containing protein n=1 Tax=Microbacterium sp. NPDC089987 TaxID=3364202 RepID=UPI00381C2BDB
MASTFGDRKKFLNELRTSKTAVSVRELIGYWGAKGRGRNVLDSVTNDLAAMKLEVIPPLDTGTLDTPVVIRSASDSTISHPDEHLLTLARIPSASFALLDASSTHLAGVVEPGTSIHDATTMMLRYDFSQLLVVDDVTERRLIGVVSWKSYAAARLRAEDPATVQEIMQPATGVDLHSDLFANIGPVVKYDFVAVTYRGRLAGIVTATDLTEQFEDLAVPFLAIGRCERELKRVAKAKFTSVDPSEVDKAMLGKLQKLYADNWASLGWSLGASAFNEWVNATRELRNKIAHFDDRDQDFSSEVRAVHRLATWLREVRT